MIDMISFPYPGGKSRLFRKKLLEFVPGGGCTYVEPFAGKGNAFWQVVQHCHFRHYWLNDIRTAEFFTALKRSGDKITVPPRPETRSVYQRLRYEKSDEALILEPYLTFSGMGYAHAGVKGADGGARESTYQENIAEAHRVLNNVNVNLQITDSDWRSMGLEKLSSNDFVYFDPPYKDRDLGAYSSSDICHEELVQHLLNDPPYRWMLSEYENPIYEPLGHPFWRFNIPLQTKGGTKRDRRVECVWIGGE